MLAALAGLGKKYRERRKAKGEIKRLEERHHIYLGGRLAFRGTDYLLRRLSHLRRIDRANTSSNTQASQAASHFSEHLGGRLISAGLRALIGHIEERSRYTHPTTSAKVIVEDSDKSVEVEEAGSRPGEADGIFVNFVKKHSPITGGKRRERVFLPLPPSIIKACVNSVKMARRRDNLTRNYEQTYYPKTKTKPA